MTDTLLIVDDEADLLQGLKRMIAMECDCVVHTAENGHQAIEILDAQPVDVVLADIRMPGMDGLALLNAIKETHPAITVIIMTAYGSIEQAVEAIKQGAYDFIRKPLDEERLIHLLSKGFELNRLVRENARLMQQLCDQDRMSTMVGQSAPIRAIFQKIRMLAPTDVTVLVRGETGTGKELAARAIHEASHRRDEQMVTVNCPALPENILESELFGYRKGAFTDAKNHKTGLFQQAHKGSIFLDEIGDLSPSLQTKLLRVLQDKRIQPLGAESSHEVDVRIIAATNQDLEEKIASRAFREDLYYRLNVATIVMPALRSIREDIPLLATHFLKKAACEQNTDVKQLTPEVLETLLERGWPGNTRELENTLKGWNATIPGHRITLRDIGPDVSDRLPADVDGADFSRSYKDQKADMIEKFTRDYVYRLLENTGGNITLAAEMSGIKRQSLQKIIKRYHIGVDRFRKP